MNGEYARFTVTGSAGAPGSTTTYVRQAQPVQLEIADQQRTVGRVGNIDFNSTTNVAVITPGFTVSPKGSWGTGDRIRLGKTHSSGASKYALQKCSVAWNHTGPGFDQSDVKAGACPNIAGGGGGGGVAVFSEALSGDTMEALGAAARSMADDGDDEDLAESPENCDEETLLKRLDSPGKERFEEYEPDAQERIISSYCNLIKPKKKDLFEYIMEYDEEEVTRDWVRMVRTQDKERVSDALEYLIDDLNNNGVVFGKENKIDGFSTAMSVNKDDRESEEAIPPHREPGIVTHISIKEDYYFARVYGSNTAGGIIKGSFLLRPRDIRYRSKQTLVQDFALIDAAMVNSHGSDIYPWANYSCIGKVRIEEKPVDPLEMNISYTSQISANDIESLEDDPTEPIYSSRLWGDDATLEGGTIQYELNDSFWIGDDKWIPLGTIHELNIDPGGKTFSDVWEEATINNRPSVDQTCSMTS